MPPRAAPPTSEDGGTVKALLGVIAILGALIGGGLYLGEGRSPTTERDRAAIVRALSETLDEQVEEKLRPIRRAIQEHVASPGHVEVVDVLEEIRAEQRIAAQDRAQNRALAMESAAASRELAQRIDELLAELRRRGSP